jgi:hypothetical protein
VDVDPNSLLLDCLSQEERKLEEPLELAAANVSSTPVPALQTNDLFASGRSKTLIRRSHFLMIIEQLKNGWVPPIYHALIRGRPCVAFQRMEESIPLICW